jgi:hypothetical protein
VVVVADERTPEAWALHDFSEECGVHFAAPKSIVIDHSSGSADHTTIKSSRCVCACVCLCVCVCVLCAGVCLGVLGARWGRGGGGGNLHPWAAALWVLSGHDPWLRPPPTAPAPIHPPASSPSYIDSVFAVGDSKNKGPVVFRGIGQSLRPDNILASALLTAPPNAYSAIPSEVLWAGRQGLHV